MTRILLLALSILAITSAPARGEEEQVDVYGRPLKSITRIDRTPLFAYKLRLVPIFGGIVSSVNASRFDHGVGVDVEKWFTTTSSISVAAIHSRITVGVSDKDAGGVVDQTYYEEWQVGGYYTYYNSPFIAKPRSYTRLGVYLLLPSNDRPFFNASDSTRLTNHAVRDLGFRATLDYGFAMKMGEASELEIALGFSIYLSNPYNFNIKAGNYSPNYLKSAVFGIADFCPTLTLDYGFVTF